ncbi:uncharacterized protein TNCV_2843801 [Trichonephila clavipes]|nr:uncharacterized protein TNCV_2843801 [Trichonephila clavipes]
MGTNSAKCDWHPVCRILLNSADKFKGVIIGSMGTTNNKRTRGQKPRLVGLIPYKAILKHNNFTSSRLDTLKKPIKEFFRCKIISSTGKRNCTIDDAIIGSYYSDSDFFGICYTINSKWKQPNKTIEKIKRSDKIEIEFYVDLDDRHTNATMDTVVRPKFNYPSFVVTQLGLHNNYVSLNPYQNGVEFQGGKQYEITLKQAQIQLREKEDGFTDSQYAFILTMFSYVIYVSSTAINQSKKSSTRFRASRDRHVLS